MGYTLGGKLREAWRKGSRLTGEIEGRVIILYETGLYMMSSTPRGPQDLPGVTPEIQEQEDIPPQ